MGKNKNHCFHCGETFSNQPIIVEEKHFCCNGCFNVFQILNQHELQEYYCLNEYPGRKMDGHEGEEKFIALDNVMIAQKFIVFQNNQQTQVNFYLPQIHCSSCLWLLENLNTINGNILQAQVNFTSKTILITFLHNEISIKEVATLLQRIGYEPLIDTQYSESDYRLKSHRSKTSYLKIGIAGFCFSNIMLISFPEYLGLDIEAHSTLHKFFTWVNLFLSLPVVFFCAKEFFVNAYYSIQQRYLNIDAPIALAIAVTFLRSVYEVFTGTGVGFFDSMTGIVFFMLLGRTLQNRSYTTLNFNRSYQSYFPLAISRIKDGVSETVPIHNIQEHDLLYIHHREVIPTDGLLSKGEALIDYSYITGESVPEKINKGEIVYAGGRNVGASIEMVAVKPFNQNSFVQLWNNKAFNKLSNEKESFITIISKYFSIIVILISLSSFIYWYRIDVKIAWQSATAVLIVACPCALLLTSSFTYGYLLELFAKYNIFFKNARAIEDMSKCEHIAFDKTGTITEVLPNRLSISENTLTENELNIFIGGIQQSTHPLSQALFKYFSNGQSSFEKFHIEELPGLGIQWSYDGNDYKVGSPFFITGNKLSITSTEVWTSINNQIKLKCSFPVTLKAGMNTLINRLSTQFSMSLISGDNESSRYEMQQLFPPSAPLLFKISPEEKLLHIKQIQSEGKKVIMVGDGLNDAGALKQSDIGITVVKDSFSFSPACDVILEDKQLPFLPNIYKICRASQIWIWIGFIYSIVFNVIGIYFSINGILSPLIAAILMPSSSLGIILLAFVGNKILESKYFINDSISLFEKHDKNHVYA